MSGIEIDPVLIQVEINAPLNTVWKLWTGPEHIKIWNSASEDWHTTQAENDLCEGGKFSSRMEAKDGSEGFDFEGVYTEVEKNELIRYVLTDGRKVKIEFFEEDEKTIIKEKFDPEHLNPVELQKEGWLSILGSFKNYVESSIKN